MSGLINIVTGLPRLTLIPWIAISLIVVFCSYSQASETDFRLEEYAGKVVFIDFWASWCGPCRASFPFMEELQREFGDDLVIVAINLDENRKDALEFLARFEVSFKIFYDPSAQLAEKYEVKGMPSSYLFDRSGELLGSHIGFRKKDKQQLRSEIIAALEA
ncbi:MAG: TlpA family protein disulfide reductase [Granulosicoccus sp.]|nr:TlpA family protein disulfide reductase [Granulosicoccus sp.]